MSKVNELEVQKKICFEPSLDKKDSVERYYLASPVTGSKGWLSLHHNSASTLFALGKPSDGTSKEVRSLNDLCMKMLAAYKMKTGYAVLEENISWSKNYYTVTLNHADFLTDSTKSVKNESQIENLKQMSEIQSPDKINRGNMLA